MVSSKFISVQFDLEELNFLKALTMYAQVKLEKQQAERIGDKLTEALSNLIFRQSAAEVGIPVSECVGCHKDFIQNPKHQSFSDSCDDCVEAMYADYIANQETS